jgi:hypothetical protein
LLPQTQAGCPEVRTVCSSDTFPVVIQDYAHYEHWAAISAASFGCWRKVGFREVGQNSGYYRVGE